MPVTIYFGPGLVPVVPGITFYEAFRSLILGKYSTSGVVFLRVAYGAIGLACGIADMLYRLTIGSVMAGARTMNTTLSYSLLDRRMGASFST